MLDTTDYRGQIGNHQWAFDWHYELWPWTNLSKNSSQLFIIL